MANINLNGINEIDINIVGGSETASVSDGVVTLDLTAPAGSTVLETNGVVNGDQTLLNLKAGTNVTLTDDGVGGVTIDATGGGGGSGTVTSVAMTVPTDILAVAGSPVTTSGTLAVTKANQSANQVFAGPTSGGAAAPAFRALVAGDIPNIAQSQVTSLVSDLALKAPLASPGLTGVPTAPTASPGTNTTQIATTAFVIANGGGGSVPTAISQGPDWPPASPDSMDDEFTAGSLDAKWTWLNQGAATAAFRNSCGIFSCTEASSSNDIWRGIYQSLPGSGTWQFTSKIGRRADHTDSQNVGLVLRESSSGKAVTCTIYPSGSNLEFRIDNRTIPSGSASSYSSTPYGPINQSQAFMFENYYNNSSFLYYRVEWNGSNLLYSLSADGIYFWQLLSTSLTSWFNTAPNQIGILMEVYSSGINKTTVAVVDWFRKTA